MSRVYEVGEMVYTQLGKAKVVHLFADGSFAIEYPWGGGQVVLVTDVRPASYGRKSARWDYQVPSGSVS